MEAPQFKIKLNLNSGEENQVEQVHFEEKPEQTAETADVQQTGFQQPVFSTMAESEPQAETPKSAYILAIVGIALVACAYLYLNASNEQIQIPEEVHKVAEAIAPPPVVHQAEVARKVLPTSDLTSQNPYLPLKLVMDQSPKLRVAASKTKKIEESVRSGLESGIYYQKYRSVESIIKNRIDGHEEVLREALLDGKFWIRMNAVMGLAELGYSVKPEDIKTAIGDAYPELQARFFERFASQERCPEGCRFVLRGSLEHLSSVGRISVLNRLANFNSVEDQKYMVAATFDEDPKVRSVAKEYLLKNPMEEDFWWEIFDSIFNGKMS